MHEQIQGRLLRTCVRLYKDEGYASVVVRLSSLFRENREGFEGTLNMFRRYMEVTYGSEQ